VIREYVTIVSTGIFAVDLTAGTGFTTGSIFGLNLFAL
jgi:hypothetical protein